MTRKLVYIVDDEPDIRDLVARTLGEYGLRTECFANGTSVRRAIGRCRPDAVIVDLGLPDTDGLSIVKALWQDPRIGVIILTGRCSVPDRVLGLEIGADYYIVKPFEPRELVARVTSLLRRLAHVVNDTAEHHGIAQFVGWTFDPDTQTLTSPAGETDTISTAERQLLMALLHAPHRVLSREQLLDEGHRESATPYDRSIDVRISRLRKRLEDDPKHPQLIKTIYGAGYLFAANVTWQTDG